MTLDYVKDILAIREWMAKEPHLPNDLEDLMIKKCVHSCYGSLEKTKKCIEKFCTGRANMTEIYISRDPCSVKIQYAFSLGHLATYEAGENEILMYHLDEPNLEKFDYYDILKSFSIQADYWLKIHEILPEGHIIIMDLKYITLKLIPKVNIFYFQKLLIFLLEAMPVRVKKVHIVNCPSYVDKLYALVKSALPQEIKDVISFHPTHEGLHSYIDKRYLPEEYGGEAQSFKEQHKNWVQTIQGQRKMFLNDKLWKADLTKKVKSNEDNMIMNGSFRTLSID